MELKSFFKNVSFYLSLTFIQLWAEEMPVIISALDSSSSFSDSAFLPDFFAAGFDFDIWTNREESAVVVQGVTGDWSNHKLL